MLELLHIKKSYGEKIVLSDLSLQLEDGKVYTVIGPNGAGKTTLLNIIAGLAAPSEGTVKLMGEVTTGRGIKREIGFVPEFVHGLPHMSIKEMLSMECKMKLAGEGWNDAEELLKAYKLKAEENTLLSDCSTGMLKKTFIIMTLLGAPKLLLLDEPTNGVDTAGIIQLKESIEEAKARGQIVIVTSHVLDFVRMIADCAYFLKDGRVAQVVTKGENLEEVYRSLYLYE